MQEVHKIFTKTIGQRHKNHELSSENMMKLVGSRLL